MIDDGLRLFLLEYPGVTDAVGQRIYPSPLPQGSPLPAITYTDISNVGSSSNDGPDCLSRVRYQIDHWAQSREEARRVERTTRAVLSGFQGSWSSIKIGGVFRRNSWVLFEPETDLWRAISDYQVNAIGE